MSHCGLLAALTIILYGAPATFLCDSVTLISACSSSSSSSSSSLIVDNYRVLLVNFVDIIVFIIVCLEVEV